MNKFNTEVSVIIPTFNRAVFLAEAVKSVLEQTYTDFELIVVDDGSNDNTKEVLEPFAGRIRYFYQPNRGPSSARNLGICQAKGRYLSFLDSDDLWLPRKLEKQMAFIDSYPDCKICYTDEIWIRHGRRVNPKKKHQKYSGWIFQRMLPLCIVSPSSVLIERAVFDKVGLFDESLPACEDYDLWLRIGRYYPFYFISEPLIIKRGGHADQLSRQIWGLDRFRVQALLKILQENGLTPEDRRATIQTLHEKCRILITGCLKRGKLEEANKYQKILEEYQL